jgi:hypothetical protein
MGCSDKITTVLAHCKYEETHLKCKNVGTLVVYTWRKAPSFRKKRSTTIGLYQSFSNFFPPRGTPKIFCSCLVELPNTKYLKCKNVGTLVVYTWRKAPSFRKERSTTTGLYQSFSTFSPLVEPLNYFVHVSWNSQILKRLEDRKQRGSWLGLKFWNRIADCWSLLPQTNDELD